MKSVQAIKLKIGALVSQANNLHKEGTVLEHEAAELLKKASECKDLAANFETKLQN